MNIQYPHKLQIKDESGQWVDLTECRDQPNNKGEMQQLADGTYYQFQSIIFAPVATERLLTGQDVKVVGERGEKRLETEVKRFSADSFHVRIWV